MQPTLRLRTYNRRCDSLMQIIMEELVMRVHAHKSDDGVGLVGHIYHQDVKGPLGEMELHMACVVCLGF